MPRKKPSGIKKAVAKKKRTEKKAARKTGVKIRGKTAGNKKTRGKKQPGAVQRTSATPVSEIRSPEPSTLDGGTFAAREPHRPRRGMGARSAGQSGDLQGLSRREDVDSESVEELAGEGQSYEAEVVSGVEDALDPDQGEVRTREIPADDVPEEYTDKD
jgi:hypothetical protein